MSAIETTALTKSFKDIVAVDGIDFSVSDGEIFSLLGVNGAGKTTTVKMLSCLSKPTSGDAYVLGHSIAKEATTVKSLIAVSPQESAVAPNLTVRENLMLMAGVHGFPIAEQKRKTDELISKFKLSEISNKRAGKLSGGWQRRLSIAMALVSEPKVLFLDEPTLGLDVMARHELWDCICELKGKVTVILTTHYMEEAESLSDYIAIMVKGRIIKHGTAASIKSDMGTTSFEDAFIKCVKEAEEK